MGLHRFTRFVAATTFLLLIAGGVVTSTDAGLSVPDWPLSYGQLFPPMVGGILYEHSHRLIAAVVGLLIAVLAGWLWLKEPRRWVRGLGYAALGTVLLQAVLGGLTVLWVLPPAISVAHACLGQLVFCLVVSLSLVTAPTWQTPRTDDLVDDPQLRSLCLLTTVFLCVQLVLGAVIRHSGHALVSHLVGALVIVAVLGRLVWCVRHNPHGLPSLRRVVNVMALAVIGQILLGILTLMPHQQAAIATAHVALGAAILASSCVLTLLAYRGGAPQLARSRRSQAREVVADYLALTKPRLTALAVLAAVAGFLMGSSRPLDLLVLIHTLVGAALVGGGANALNQWAERDADALMSRTQSRPLPAGRLKPIEALTFGLASSGLGIGYLALGVNALAGWLAAITVVTYVGLYTPLKRQTALCTLIGAIPGAIPPLIGWAAARGELALEAWVLFAMVFFWQLPHFLAIAWVHRDEYARAGFRMLPVVEPDGSSTARQMVLYGLALLPTSLLPTILGVAGPVYFIGAAVLGAWFFWMAVSAARQRSCAVANRLFLASVGYLPLVLCLMVMDKTPV